MRTRLHGPSALVCDLPAPEDESAITIARLQLQPYVERVDGPPWEEVPDLAGADDHVHACGRPGDERRSHFLDGRRNLANLPNDCLNGLFGFLTDTEAGHRQRPLRRSP